MTSAPLYIKSNNVPLVSLEKLNRYIQAARNLLPKVQSKNPLLGKRTIDQQYAQNMTMGVFAPIPQNASYIQADKWEEFCYVAWILVCTFYREVDIMQSRLIPEALNDPLRNFPLPDSGRRVLEEFTKMFMGAIQDVLLDRYGSADVGVSIGIIQAVHAMHTMWETDLLPALMSKDG